jgi:hypothetical protein
LIFDVRFNGFGWRVHESAKFELELRFAALAGLSLVSLTKTLLQVVE